MKATVRIIGHGKVTIPAAIREALGLEDGDVVEIDVRPVSTEGGA